MFLGGKGINLLLLPGWLAQPSLGHKSQMPGRWQGRRKEGDTQPGPWEGFPVSSSEGLSGQQGAGEVGEGSWGDEKGPWHRLTLRFPNSTC